MFYSNLISATLRSKVRHVRRAERLREKNSASDLKTFLQSRQNSQAESDR